MRDWLGMTRADFDTDAADEPAGLFELDPAQVPAEDPCGTGDLLAEIDGNKDLTP
jgi:hypothetical protein